MKCFLERYLNKEDAERVVGHLTNLGHNVFMEQRFNVRDEVDVWHVLTNCCAEEYNKIKADLDGK